MSDIIDLRPYDWEGLLKRVTLDWQIGLEFRCYRPYGPLDVCRIEVSMAGSDVDTGLNRQISYSRTCPWNVGDREAVKFIWTVAMEFLEHELAEWMTVDGVRVMDPHPDGTSRSWLTRYDILPRMRVAG